MLSSRRLINLIENGWDSNNPPVSGEDAEDEALWTD